VFIIGVTSVRTYEIERDVEMKVGDAITVADFTFRFDGATMAAGPNYQAARGTVTVSRNGRTIDVLHPEKRSYFAQRSMPMTEAAIRSRISGDVYVSLGEALDQQGGWTVRVYYKPFVTWIWGGAALMALGGFLAAVDRRYRVRARREAQAGALAGGSAAA
jgi:cytochrome c-type biogenesis protein CcmF